jgi:hypothetical protein
LKVGFQDIAIEKQQSAEGLGLSGSSNIVFGSQAGDEDTNLVVSYFQRVTFIVEDDESFDPIDVGVFGSKAEVFKAADLADLVQEFRFEHEDKIKLKGRITQEREKLYDRCSHKARKKDIMR